MAKHLRLLPAAMLAIVAHTGAAWHCAALCMLVPPDMLWACDLQSTAVSIADEVPAPVPALASLPHQSCSITLLLLPLLLLLLLLLLQPMPLLPPCYEKKP
jgi:hypothetical protein